MCDLDDDVGIRAHRRAIGDGAEGKRGENTLMPSRVGATKWQALLLRPWSLSLALAGTLWGCDAREPDIDTLEQRSREWSRITT